MSNVRVVPIVLAVALVATSALVLVLSKRLRDLSGDYRDLSDRATLPHRGFVVPTFRTTTLSGDSVTVGQAADSSMRQILFVFNTTCPFCRQIIPTWQRLADSLARVNSAVQVLAVSSDPVDVTRRYVAEHRLPYPVLRFPEAKLKRLYRVAAVPQTVVLDWTGTVLFAKTGILDRSSIDSLYSFSFLRR